MIEYRQVDKAFLPQYDRIPMRVNVNACYKIEKINRGLGGFLLTETPVKPYVKDFCAGDGASTMRWARQFDTSHWAYFMAFDDERPVGAATIVSRTEGINMLAGRDDLAVLWDIRVEGAYKGQGIGQALFDMAVHWCREQHLAQLKIECQNNNVPAVKFYHKQGAVLTMIDEYAYYNEPEYRDETQLIWYLDL